ncbi:hypothetical protein OV079_47700 [Nannocystis pusilla]|uniref:Uncharacterized protein n=1 Tax=Nannocystis pusilla TaxID=889268 RepID=A0A9X3J4F7_9BACT|nr:hypothetical protein [Nannocystis pusilla]MCY1013093.1 hypothetical protein [Nannocystis pusilla]
MWTRKCPPSRYTPSSRAMLATYGDGTAKKISSASASAAGPETRSMCSVPARCGRRLHSSA